MSDIGETFSRYKDALDWSIDRFHTDRERSLSAMKEFYPAVFSRYVRRYDWLRTRTPQQWSQALHNLRSAFGGGENRLYFAAVDGTCGKEALSEMLVFYGASYAQGGTLGVHEDVGRLNFSKWSPAEDTSIVAYLPVPLSGLDLFDDEDWLFKSDDEDRSTANVIHTGLMQLAEIYLAYRRATAQDRPPHILLLDHSLSSIFMSTDVMYLVRPYEVGQQTLGWIGAQIDRWGRAFEPADGLVAHAHPMDRSLGVPSMRMNALAETLVARMTSYWQIGDTGDRERGEVVRIADLLSDPGLAEHVRRDREAFERRLQRISDRHGAFTCETGRLVPSATLSDGRQRTLRQRWYDLRQLFEHICEQLFRERRVEALQLRYPAGGTRRGPRWMSNNDLRFLVGLGLRLLIEHCWRKRILLLGVVKDSASRYFTRNYLGVLKASCLASIPDTPEPAGSDRLVCEMAPLVDQDIEAPWSTPEFDSVFMTLRATADAQGKPTCRGVRGDVLMPPDGLFLRSLIQLFLQRRSGKAAPLMGHVLFLDRIAYPYFDSSKRIATAIETRDSLIRPMSIQDGTVANIGQDVAMLAADLLTRNCFPQAIGQPDPLHRADQGAKALGKRINDLVRASVQRLRANPMSWSFRDLRTRLGG